MSFGRFILLLSNFLSCCNIVESFLAASSGNDYVSTYKAAVYEHPLVIPATKAQSYDEAVEQMMLNLNDYKNQTDVAGSQNVDIIVFPEDGIYSYRLHRPTDLAPYLEYIPDPSQIDWTPCADPDRFKRTKVQTFLSCLAKNNSIYLVANYGDAQPCASKDSNCPSNGQYQYNTNVVFDRQGKLIAKYHKQHLFFERQFQEPAKPEIVYFDTDFGRFGTFTCFDIIFRDPAIPLVETYNITDVVFPTAWIDGLPIFTAIGYHSAFAAAYNVNFLAANLHVPTHGFLGSGIYTPDGPIDFYYDRLSPNGRLIIRDVPIRKPTTRSQNGIKFTFGATELQAMKAHEFKAQIFHDSYDVVALTSKKGNVTVCKNGHCCFLSYERDQVVGNYAFGVFNGVHRAYGPWYIEVCILLKCASQDNQSCGKLTYIADGYFNTFTIRGNFSTPYVTPQIIRSNNGNLELPPLGAMKYDTNGLSGDAKETPLLEASLVGRVYDRD